VEYEYYINKDERGEFYADVRDPRDGLTMYEFSGFWMFEDGFMTNKHDMIGLRDYMVNMGLCSYDDDIIPAN